MWRLWRQYKRKSFRFKVFLYTAGLILITALIILIVVSFQVRNRMQNVLEHDLAGVHNVLIEYEKARLELFKNKAMLLSEEPRLKAALDTRDPETVKQQAENFLSVLASDFLVITDADGVLMANFSNIPLPENLEDVPSIKSALDGAQSVALYMSDSTLFQMISSPVAILDPLGRLNLLGTVTIGLTMGEKLLRTLSELTDCTIGFMQRPENGQGVWLRFSPAVTAKNITSTAEKNLSSLSSKQNVQRIKFDGEEYLLIISPLLTDMSNAFLLLMTSLDDALRPILRPTQQALFGIGLAAILMSLAFSFWLSRGISSPIIQLVQAAQNVSQGDLKTPINVKAGDEIGILASSFEEMRQSLQQNIDNLQKTFARLMISEKLATTGKLLAHLSHELNNPIHNIRSALEAGLKKITESDKAMIEIAYDEILRLERLVRQTLDFYRPGTGERVPVNLNALLAEMAAVSRESFRTKNISIRMNLDESVVPVLANRDQVKQVFLNLLLNSRDALPQGGEIFLQTENNDEGVTVCVRDNGVGISLEKQDKIFDAFYTTKSQVSGVGLGLSVSYEIINQHGGAIVLNPDYTDGAEFIVTLPR
jgi:signal transduction histidine kinase